MQSNSKSFPHLNLAGLVVPVNIVGATELMLICVLVRFRKIGTENVFGLR